VNEIQQPEQARESKLVSVATGARSELAGLIPKDFNGLYKLAQIMAASNMMPKGCEEVAQVFVSVQMGLEVGLSPMQSVQNIACINGRPTIWGDAAKALCLSSPACEWVDEQPIKEGDKTVGYRCEAKRAGVEKTVVREFTVLDAKTAGLWNKQGPWQQYPQRMLQMRARSWCLRDAFPDVLKGMYLSEEANDITDVTPEEDLRELIIDTSATAITPDGEKPVLESGVSGLKQQLVADEPEKEPVTIDAEVFETSKSAPGLTEVPKTEARPRNVVFVDLRAMMGSLGWDMDRTLKYASGILEKEVGALTELSDDELSKLYSDLKEQL